MKTPREIILERHQSAEAKLADLRPERLAALARPSDTSKDAASFRSVLEQFWRESIWPWHRVWAGLATVWIAILAMNLTADTSSSREVGTEMANTKDPEVQAVLREQKQLLTQLLGPIAPTDALPIKPPGPRSEQQRELFIA